MGTSGYMTSGAGGSSAQKGLCKGNPRGWNNHREYDANHAVIKLSMGIMPNRAERRALKHRKVVP